MTIEFVHQTPATISIGRPGLQVAVAGDPLAQSFPIVVRRSTLRDAQRARSLLRAGTHDPANFVVALEVEAAIAPHPASARASAADEPVRADDTETIRYVGTPRGLVSLIRDIYVAEIADAVIIVPLDGSATAARVREQVLPVLDPARGRVA
ncbi:hypothetical protein [Gordonia insulae]|uniref:Luciferase-like domain-containing protein n=1 Tax=Gordonia insulae TaxID=2420509 RepID=A0A3G8JSG1_9ACTN|nr:hypothetical protein [Gordonia insulae]AZG47846.1 hypothetical protein D7316_04458 [Gordonia insulae]